MSHTSPNVPVKDKQDPIAMKVMRLTKPSLQHSLVQPFLSLPGDFVQSGKNIVPLSYQSTFNISSFNMSQLLGLPTTFGDILIGETFSCYISIHNHSDETLKDVSIKAEIQTSHAQKIVVVDTESTPISVLYENERHDFIVKYEVEEAHILVCLCQYTSGDGVRKFFRKYFRFSVGEPFHITTNSIPTLNGHTNTISISNISPKVLCIESVEFIPNSNFNVKNISPAISSILGMGDSKQYLHQLTYKNVLDPLKDDIEDLGKWAIIWRGPIGEKGVKNTPLIKSSSGKPKKPISLLIEKVKGPHQLQKLFTINIIIINQTNNIIRPTLSIHSSSMKNSVASKIPKNFSKFELLVVGKSSFTCEPIAPLSHSTPITVQLIGLNLGILHLAGMINNSLQSLTVVDTTNNDTFEYHNILEVNILKDTELNVSNEEQLLLDLEVKQKAQQQQQQFIQNNQEVIIQEKDVQLTTCTTENKVIVDVNNGKEYIELADSNSDHQKIEREQFGLGNIENFDNVDDSIPLSITEILNDNNEIMRKKQNEILTGESNGEDIEGNEINSLNLNSSQSIVDIDLHSSQSINSANQSLNSSQSIVDSIADIDLNASRGEEDKILLHFVGSATSIKEDNR